MAKKQKYYVVWEGNEIGIFESWADCQLSIKGYPNAKYKSFKTRAEAEDALHDDHKSHYKTGTGKTKKTPNPAAMKDVIWNSLSVDAACSGNPGIMEYRGVDTKTQIEFFRQGPFQAGTNNIGEFLALVHGLAYCKREGKTYPIYTDSRTALAWIKKKKVNTTVSRTTVNAKMFDMVDRALVWLHNNSWKNEIIKWNTEEWGEIPADFGRK